MEKITTILTIAVGIIILIIVIFLIGKAIGIFKKDNPVGNPTSVSIEKPEQIVMPGVQYMTYEKATEILESQRLKAKITWQESNDYDEGVVISTSVKEGLKVDVGAEIILTVSSGASSVIVPDVVNKSLAEANKAILDADLKVDILQSYSEEVSEGYIISQSPEADLTVPPESTVIITVSLGAPLDAVTVPSVLSKTQEEAVKELEDLGLVVDASTETYNNIYEVGSVCFQTLSPNSEVEKGSKIELQISKGVEPATEATVLYKYSANINAPSTAEDSDYASGTKVKIVVSGLDGKELFSTETTSFPVSINLTNISGSNAGLIKLTYDVKLDPVTKTDADGKETVVTPGKTETRTIKREIDFELQK